jgi:hypothetical protein
LSALSAAADIALALQKVPIPKPETGNGNDNGQPKPESGNILVHHGDLIHEAIECMKSNRCVNKHSFYILTKK